MRSTSIIALAALAAAGGAVAQSGDPYAWLEEIEGARPLDQVRKWNAETDAELTTITAKGKGKMPAYEAKLSADDIKALVAHMRTMKK